MYSYIAESYAGVLTKGDIIQLFNNLTLKLSGNRSEAARRSRLTGKTTYDWEKVGYMKLDTKVKVLETCLENDFLNTIEYILNRCGERTIDILRTVLLTIYSEAIETQSESLFKSLLDRFEMIMMRYRGTIRDKLENEISEMIFALEQKALEVDIPLPQKSVLDISAKEILNMLPLIEMEYARNPLDPQKTAKNLNVPIESIKKIWSALESLQSRRLIPKEELNMTTNMEPTEGVPFWSITLDTYNRALSRPFPATVAGFETQSLYKDRPDEINPLFKMAT